MDQDRKALLEKKRQRLQELKQRRTELPLVTQLNVALDPPVAPMGEKIDFAVQVGPPQHETIDKHKPVVVKQETFQPDTTRKLDKIVQTDSTRHTSPKEELSPAEPKALDVEKVALPSSEDQIENALRDMMKHLLTGLKFSDLRLGIKRSIKHAQEDTVPLNVSVAISGFLQRPIIELVTSPEYPTLIVCVYGKPIATPLARRNLLTALAGLAVIFNRDGDSLIPEFFLQCISPITTLRFDESNHFHLVAGCENGRLVMWDLSNVKPTQIALLPTLQTSTVASHHESQQQGAILHVSPIVFLGHINPESSRDLAILSICADGLVNVWSPNLFASPKFPTVKISDPALRGKNSLRVTGAMFMSESINLSNAPGYHEHPELRFLDLLVLATKRGNLIFLTNDKSSSFVRATLDTGVKEQIRNISINSLGITGSTLSKRFILTAHEDWFLRAWSIEKLALFYDMPTDSVVKQIIVRPGHWSQIVTLGYLRPPFAGICVEFWDLNIRTSSLLFKIPTENKLKGNAAFTADGSHIVLAFEDGDIVVWEMDDDLLLSLISAIPKRTIYENIESGLY